MNSNGGAFFGFGNILASPFIVATLASLVCSLGLGFIVQTPKKARDHSTARNTHRAHTLKKSTGEREKLIFTSIGAVSVTTIVLAWTKSLVLTLPFTLFSMVVTWIHFRNKGRRTNEAMLQVWPEVTDHLISAIHSGLSLTEALVGLGNRGPELIRPYFVQFHRELLESGNFVASAERLKARLNTHGSDQIMEGIIMAKSLGGSELLQIFRTLGDFLRQDLTLRKEIDIKHGWIKNSAHLSSAAPWLLLLLLSTQPGTAEAFAQPGGMMILILGLLLTATAYLWMGKLGQLPTQPRVFE